MRIWHGNIMPDLAAMNRVARGSMAEYIGIELTGIGDDYLAGTMPVDRRTHQPYGLLHGGASVVLAETLGSVGGALTVDAGRQRVVGLDINANHVRGIRNGHVTGTARPLHLGRSTQVWSIEINDESERLVCIARLTLAVIDGGATQ